MPPSGLRDRRELFVSHFVTDGSETAGIGKDGSGASAAESHTG